MTPSPSFVRWLPRLLILLAVLMLVELVFPAESWIDKALDLLWTWVVPLNPVDFVSAVVLILLAGALSIRKRGAWWALITLLGALLIITGAVAVILLLTAPNLLTWDFATGTVIPLIGIGGLITYRGYYTAKTQPRGLLKGLLVLAGGIILTIAVVLIAQTFAGGLTLVHAKQILAELFGFRVNTDSSWVLSVFGFGSGAAIILALWTMLRSGRDGAGLDFAEEQCVRQALADHPGDSLGYFSTRRDRSVLVVENTILTYRVEKGVCLAAGDPIGPPVQWEAAARSFLAHAQNYGWVPAVLAASADGARAYSRAGLKVLHVGDEAVLNSRDYTLAALPEVQRSVAKLSALGYCVRIRSQSEIPEAELDALADFAEEFRAGESERGFSMALGRPKDPSDGGRVHVQALFPPGDGPLASTTAGLLSFVPWGANGVSLDVMRRHSSAENGITEFMVAGLMSEATSLGIASVSLNFAVFRSAFEQGRELGAGPVKVLWRNILLFASRFWQLESLYRSNEKYHPTWLPRMLCYPDGSDLARIGLAVSLAEGFLTPPPFFGLGSSPQPPRTPAEAVALNDITPTTVGTRSQSRVPDQVRQRLRVRSRMLEQGVQPYPAEAVGTGPEGTAVDSAGTLLSGRVLGIRDHGGVVFLDIRAAGRDVQAVCERAAISAIDYARLRSWVSRGDRITLHGVNGTSRNSTPSLLATTWAMAAKSLRPWPNLAQGFNDPEAKVRRRYLDFTLNPAQRDIVVIRSKALRAVRETLQARDFFEVETPILQTVHGGANARPFRTRINAYDLDLYLRIAPELYLKRMLVGGFDRVFEMGRNFRNEGVDATHNPEFSMLEAYQAGGDYSTMRELVRTLVISAAKASLDTTLVRGRVNGVEHEIDLAEEWRTISLTDAVSEKLGEEISTATPVQRLQEVAGRIGLDVKPTRGWGALLQDIYEEVAESSTIAPTFYTDFPAETSPLTRQHRKQPLLAEKWDLIIFGTEVATAYSELVDPVIQRARLTAQSLAATGGDPEAMELDEDFLLALEHGMPPAGGLGMGLDRLVMLLTGQSIRSTISFPLARPEGS